MSSLPSTCTSAVDAVRLAAKLTTDVSRRLVEGHTLEKDDRSPVTVADFGAQALILSWLAEGFPEIPAVGEEDASSLKEDNQAELLESLTAFVTAIDPGMTAQGICTAIDRGNHGGGATERFWTLDPIDGTKGFLRGQQYTIALALIEAGHPVLGVLGCPNLHPFPETSVATTGWIFYGTKETPPYSEPLIPGHPPAPLRVSATSDPAEAVFCESVESAHSSHDASSQIAQILGTTSEPVRIDSQCKYAAVARGEADLYLRLPTKPGYREKIWDHAAGAFLVEQAGGMVTDIDGKPLDFSLGKTLENNRGIVASNGTLHPAILEAIQKVDVSPA